MTTYYMNGEEVSEKLALQIAHEFTLKRCLSLILECELAWRDRAQNETARKWFNDVTKGVLEVVIEED
jgi:hypothetical protein